MAATDSVKGCTTVNPMGPFRENATCPKCWGEEIGVVHHDHEYRSRYGCAAVGMFGTSYPPEHLCRTCKRCHYSWPERLAADS